MTNVLKPCCFDSELKFTFAAQPLPIELPQSTVTTDLVVFSASETKSEGGLAGMGVAEYATVGIEVASVTTIDTQNFLTCKA